MKVPHSGQSISRCLKKHTICFRRFILSRGVLLQSRDIFILHVTLDFLLKSFLICSLDIGRERHRHSSFLFAFSECFSSCRKRFRSWGRARSRSRCIHVLSDGPQSSLLVSPPNISVAYISCRTISFQGYAASGRTDPSRLCD